MFKVMIHPADYDNVRNAVDSAFENFPTQVTGKKVLIKPNVLRSSEAEEGIVTHPAVLRSVVEKVEAMDPASIIVGDNPGLFNYGANEESFKKTGLMDAAKGYYQNIGDDSQKVEFNPEFMPTVSLSQAVFEADIKNLDSWYCIIFSRNEILLFCKRIQTNFRDSNTPSDLRKGRLFFDSSH